MPKLAQDSWFEGFLQNLLGEKPVPPSVTPNLLAQNPAAFPPSALKNIDHATLYSARRLAPPEAQNRLSPYEHRAFAREATAENPLMALPIAAGTLAYQPYKALMGQSRSDPSLSQVGQGLAGVKDGLVEALRARLLSK